MKLSAFPQHAVKIIHKNVTRPLGQTGDRLRIALNASYARRRKGRIAGTKSKRHTHLLFASDVRDFLAGNGLAEELSLMNDSKRWRIMSKMRSSSAMTR